MSLIAALLILATQDENPYAFRDVTEESGLMPHVGGIRGHAAGWGDADGDGWIDLYVGTFHDQGSKANLFFRNSGGKFKLDDQAALRISTRANSALFADFDNDGDHDLYVASMPGNLKGQAIAPCTLFRNDGGGRYTDVSKENGACPPADFAGRSAAALDFDGDGLLDLLVGDCVFTMYRGKKSSRLFRNKGGLQFEDVTQAVGLPAGIPGLGVAAGDVTGDGWPDLFIAGRDGSNRLFLNDGTGKFREAPGSPKTFDWGPMKGDNTPAGAAFGDVNRDGQLDLVIGQHFSTPWKEPTAVRLYVNRGKGDFLDVTDAAGLKPLPMKAPHVELQDFDNDGWPDLYTSIVTFAGGKPHPVIHRNLGGSEPKFREFALGAIDFPNAEDKSIGRSGEFFNKLIRDKKIIYTAPGPSGDFDNDGRLDVFLANWWIEMPSMLLRNESRAGNWLKVRIEGGKGVNRQGIGSLIKVYAAGKAGQASALIGCREMAIGFGYTSGQPSIAHFGLGREETCDVEIIFPHGKGKAARAGVKANQLLEITP